MQGAAAIVTGGASGLGAATARRLAQSGARVAILDLDGGGARAVADELGGLGLQCDITDSDSLAGALDAAQSAHGAARIIMSIAGIAGAKRLVDREGLPAPLDHFRRIIEVNLIGAYNVARLAAARMIPLAPLEDDERGVMVLTASVAAFDGQVGQQAYAASKGGIASMTLPMARDLASFGIRVVTIAPGVFLTPMVETLPEAARRSLAESIPFPKRLGRPSEFAELAAHIVGNTALNGEVIRLDGALRMAPR